MAKSEQKNLEYSRFQVMLEILQIEASWQTFMHIINRQRFKWSGHFFGFWFKVSRSQVFNFHSLNRNSAPKTSGLLSKSMNFDLEQWTWNRKLAKKHNEVWKLNFWR